MPSYDYTCEDDHVYTENRSIHEDQKVFNCPECGKSLNRIYTAIPATFQGEGFYAAQRKKEFGL